MKALIFFLFLGGALAQVPGTANFAFWQKRNSGPSLNNTGLVLRYRLNEATSGTGPVTVTDSAPGPFNLTLSYSTNLSWAETSGNSALASNDVNGVGAAASAGNINGTKVFTMLDGVQKFTFEVVVDVQSCFNDYGRMMWIDDGTDSGNPAIGCNSNQILVALSNIKYTFPHNPTTQGRSVYHIVVDTTQATDSERAKLYRNGAYVTDTSSSIPQDTALSMETNNQVYLVNRNGGSRSINGKLYYAALYNVAMSPATISAQATILATNDD